MISFGKCWQMETSLCHSRLTSHISYLWLFAVNIYIVNIYIVNIYIVNIYIVNIYIVNIYIVIFAAGNQIVLVEREKGLDCPVFFISQSIFLILLDFPPNLPEYISESLGVFFWIYTVDYSWQYFQNFLEFSSLWSIFSNLAGFPHQIFLGIFPKLLVFILN